MVIIPLYMAPSVCVCLGLWKHVYSCERRWRERPRGNKRPRRWVMKITSSRRENGARKDERGELICDPTRVMCLVVGIA